MATMLAGWAPLEKLEEIVSILKERKEKGFKFTVSIADETNEYGQNVSLFAEQTKQQRDEKMPRYYFGNGKVFWTDGKISVADKKEKITTPTAAELTKATAPGDLPF